MAIAALIQATVGMLYDLHSQSNKSYRIYSRALIMENKFRAARYGIEGKLIDFRPGGRSADARSDDRVH